MRRTVPTFRSASLSGHPIQSWNFEETLEAVRSAESANSRIGVRRLGAFLRSTPAERSVAISFRANVFGSLTAERGLFGRIEHFFIGKEQAQEFLRERRNRTVSPEDP